MLFHPLQKNLVAIFATLHWLNLAVDFMTKVSVVGILLIQGVVE